MSVLFSLNFSSHYRFSGMLSFPTACPAGISCNQHSFMVLWRTVIEKQNISKLQMLPRETGSDDLVHSETMKCTQGLRRTKFWSDVFICSETCFNFVFKVGVMIENERVNVAETSQQGLVAKSTEIFCIMKRVPKGAPIREGIIQGCVTERRLTQGKEMLESKHFQNRSVATSSVL